MVSLEFTVTIVRSDADTSAENQDTVFAHSQNGGRGTGDGSEDETYGRHSPQGLHRCAYLRK